MGKIVEFEKSQWEGNKWPCIVVHAENHEDYDPERFKRIFNFIKEAFSDKIDQNASVGTLGDVYGARFNADFKIADSSVMMDMDDFSFSIAFSRKKTRDDVYEKLNQAKEEL